MARVPPVASTLPELGSPHDVVDPQLLHLVGNAVSRAYNGAERLDERRAMMQRWADYLDGLNSPAASTMTPTAAMEARLILRKLMTDIRFVPDPDGGLYAEYEVRPGAILRGVGTDGSGGALWHFAANFQPRGAVQPHAKK